MVAPGSGFVSKIPADPFPSSPVKSLMHSQGLSPAGGIPSPSGYTWGGVSSRSWDRARLAQESLV